MFALLLLLILIHNISLIEIEQSPKHFQINENSPNGTTIGIIKTYPSDYLMTLIDGANGHFDLNSMGELFVSTYFILVLNHNLNII
ncbi:unnamed protein product [Rotaria socialis]|uniref:Uncharacterized protein n=1 Tax=Rotaria socialis TaxID=392032 RepID=A0A819VBJ8_9BILA|nr:unnamed protein product [Rotaria socialis]CAF3393110.1 unnamed protein product [Rotaria socialis]CAF3546041.1 unnamed protein product [Rotaria socialis]CAF3616751.1 unnamed protein product [Rotaria socialis]CAF3727519.1 unnamed protein product [Rotaria socialis]